MLYISLSSIAGAGPGIKAVPKYCKGTPGKGPRGSAEVFPRRHHQPLRPDAAGEGREVGHRPDPRAGEEGALEGGAGRTVGEAEGAPKRGERARAEGRQGDPDGG